MRLRGLPSVFVIAPALDPPDDDKAMWSRFMCQNEIYPLFDANVLDGPKSFVTQLQQVFPR